MADMSTEDERRFNSVDATAFFGIGILLGFFSCLVFCNALRLRLLQEGVERGHAEWRLNSAGFSEWHWKDEGDAGTKI